MKTVLITGATDGIGKVAAHKFAGAGFRTLIHGRNPVKIENIVKELTRKYPVDVEGFRADFSRLHEVSTLGESLSAQLDRLDILINNAGLGPGSKDDQSREVTAEGYELRFTVNYLAPFVFTRSLLPLLKKSQPARIINVSSAAQSAIDLNNTMLEKGYSGSKAYSQSKMALMSFTISLSEQLRDTGITVNALHPGSLLDTNMVREAFGKSWGKPEEGADAIFYLATNPELAAKSGSYFNQKKEERAFQQVYDKTFREKLWKITEELVQNKTS